MTTWQHELCMSHLPSFFLLSAKALQHHISNDDTEVNCKIIVIAITHSHQPKTMPVHEIISKHKKSKIPEHPFMETTSHTLQCTLTLSVFFEHTWAHTRSSRNDSSPSYRGSTRLVPHSAEQVTAIITSTLTKMEIVLRINQALVIFTVLTTRTR